MEPNKNYKIRLGQEKINNYRSSKQAVFSKGDDYIFEVKKISSNQLAVSASNGCIKIYDSINLSCLNSLQYHNDVITSIKPLSKKFNDGKFLSSSKDGTVALWDIRVQNNPVRVWTDGRNGINSFDINCEGNILATGTFLNNDHDAKLLFWDFGGDKLIQEFVECHNDDITLMQFHPEENNKLISGGMDGLICMYNLVPGDEDESLDKVLNFKTSLMDFGYFGLNNQFIYALSHMETFTVFNIEGDIVHDFGSIKGASCYGANGFAVDYVIGCQYDPNGNELYLLGGSYDGNIGIFRVNDGGELYLNEVLSKGHSDVVRSLHIDFMINEIISGAEDGKLLKWSPFQGYLTDTLDQRQNNTKKEIGRHIRFSPY